MIIYKMKIQERYNIKPMQQIKAQHKMIIGEKSNGKSYQAKHIIAIDHYLETGNRFILERRYREDLSSLWIEQYFADVDVFAKTNGKYNCITCYRKVLYFGNYEGESGKVKRGEKIRVCCFIINRTTYVFCFFS